MKRKQLIAGILAVQCLFGSYMTMPLIAAEASESTLDSTEVSTAQDNKTVVGNETIYQVSTLNALMLGYYDGVVSVEDLTANGDTGLGTFDTLDGEMIVLDGVVYKAKSDGTVEKMENEITAPFAAVTHFDKDIEVKGVKDLSNIEDIKSLLDKNVGGNKNLFYVAKIKGEFNMVHVRSVPAQEKPYKPLSEIAATQPEFTYDKVSGTIVALRCPDYVEGINLPGWHLHFVSDDCQKGGHLLDASLKLADIQIDSTSNYSIVLPETDAFGALKLKEDLSQKTQQVEGKQEK